MEITRPGGAVSGCEHLQFVCRSGLLSGNRLPRGVAWIWPVQAGTRADIAAGRWKTREQFEAKHAIWLVREPEAKYGVYPFHLSAYDLRM